MRVHDQNATRMQNVQYGRKRETGPKREEKKAESTKLNVVAETFTQRSSLPGPRREGVAVFEKSGDVVYVGETPYYSRTG